MYRWPWLERKIQSHPSIGVAIALGLLALCAWILVSDPRARSPRSGMPIWWFATAGIVLFGYAGFRCIQEVARRRKGGEG
jgi:TRAP-type C4-dicarboxylate transport system permease small subunit